MEFAEAYLQYELATIAATALAVAVFVLADLMDTPALAFLVLVLAVLCGFVVALVALRVARTD